MTENAITLHDLNIRYGKTLAVHDVSAHFARGSLTAVAGPNGAGKSTLLKTIAGILKPSSGCVHIAPDLENHMAYLPQSAGIRHDFPMPVLQAVCTGFWRVSGDTGAINADMRDRARKALADVGLADFEDHQVSSLSGGQFQRMLFARVILEDARIILLDEPFTAIDGETTAKLIQILLQWHKEGRTIVCVLHDLLLIHKYFPESFVLAGRCMGRGHTHDMFDQKLLSYDLDMAELYPAGETPKPYTHLTDCGHDHH